MTPAGRDPGPERRFARLVSIVGHPFLWVPVSVGLAAPGSRGVWLVLGAFVLLSVVIVRRVRRGEWNDVDVSDPRKRPALLRMTTLVLAAITALSFATPAPVAERVGVASALGLVVAAWAISSRVKASLHVAFDLVAVAIASAVSPIAALVALPLVALVGWSRLVLGRHDARELAVGTVLGGLAAVPILAVAHGPWHR